MIDAAIKKAMLDGVLSGVRDATENSFKVYCSGCADPEQAKRTTDGLIATAEAADRLLGFIEALQA